MKHITPTVFLLIIAGFLSIVIFFFYHFITLVCKNRSQNREVATEEQEKTYSKYKEEYQGTILMSYDLRVNPVYSNAINVMERLYENQKSRNSISSGIVMDYHIEKQ